MAKSDRKRKKGVSSTLLTMEDLFVGPSVGILPEKSLLIPHPKIVPTIS